jgi:type IV secretory pathway VirB4 component
MQDRAEKAGCVTNYNAFIMGPSGSGKSFFTNTLVRNLYDAGETVFIIDIGDSYEGLCSVINDQSGG